MNKTKIVKKYTPKRYRKRTYRIQRNVMKLDSISIQCENYILIATSNGSADLTNNISLNSYLSIVDNLGASPSFLQQRALYNRYKITGLSVRCNYCISVDTCTTNVGFAPNVCAAFYPSSTATNLGSDPIYNDSKLYLESGNTVPVSKYWRFPDDYFDGGATGFGVWSSTNSYASQIGQLSFAMAPPRIASGTIAFLNVKVTSYIVFSGKKI